MQNSDKAGRPTPDNYIWGDAAWLFWRSSHPVTGCPMNIYELHLGSWRRTADGRLLTWREITRFLVPYMKEMGFTHVHLLPVTEHPPDDPWGYRCTDFFSATDRFGPPHDLKYLIDELHRAGIGVLLDWVCARSPEEDFSDEEFLISSALFWLEEYHIDGLRPVNPYDGADTDLTNRFLRRLNNTVLAAHPDILMIGSDLNAADQGFSLKWSTPFQSAPSAQPVILSLSHDEVVHGKGSLLSRMPGSDPDKYAGVRAFYTYMLAYPGKKLLMMGSEFGQWNEWNHEQSLDWHLLAQQDEDGNRHRQLQAFFRAANAFYLNSPALWQLDFSPEGFCRICGDDAQENTAVFLRFDKQGHGLLIAVSFSPMSRRQYRIGVPFRGRYKEVFSTDRIEFGGEGHRNPFGKVEDIPCHGMKQSLQVDLPPLGAVILSIKNFPPKIKTRRC